MTASVITTSTMSWNISDRFESNGRRIDTDTELSIRGERGRFRFMRLVITDKGMSWIDVYGGKAGHETVRSFHPSKVKTVHRKRTMRRKDVQS